MAAALALVAEAGTSVAAALALALESGTSLALMLVALVAVLAI